MWSPGTFGRLGVGVALRAWDNDKTLHLRDLARVRCGHVRHGQHSCQGGYIGVAWDSYERATRVY